MLLAKKALLSPHLSMLATLFDWARQRGVWISDSVEIRTTPYGGKGLYAATDITADTELVRLPGRMQLGIPHLADDDDEELQRFAQCLPPLDLRFLPCAVALCAEARKGRTSVFHGYIRELPAAYSNAIAPCDGFGDDAGDDHHDAPSGLVAWEPDLAAQVARTRRTVRALHKSSAPDSLPLRDLCWAAAGVCSRSFTRRPHRVRRLTEEEAARVGAYAAADRTRLLPVIDTANHAVPLSAANADVRHEKGSHISEHEYDPLSTSLVATREIMAGSEVLLDYGAGPSGMPHERTLVDFGFACALPPHGDDYTAELPLEPRLWAAAPAVATEDEKYLRIYVTGMRRNVEPGALRFDATGEPSAPTLALALALSTRGAEDVAALVRAVDSDEAEAMAEEELLAHIVARSAAAPREYARAALAEAAEAALAQIESAAEAEREGAGRGERAASKASDGSGASFDAVAREYRGVVREMLRRVVERCGAGRC